MNLRLAVPVAAVLVLLAAYAIRPLRQTETASAAETITVATPRTPLSALLVIAQKNGDFARQGLNVILLDAHTGKAALQDALAGRADLAATGSLPIASAVAEGAPVQVLATIARTEDDAFIVVRGDRDVAGVRDLEGKRVGVAQGTALELFLEAALVDAGVPPQRVHRVDLHPEAALQALQNGQLDAVVQHWGGRLPGGPGSGSKTFAPALYTLHWNLAGNKAFLDAHPRTSERLLRALLAAESYALQQRERAAELLADGLAVSREDMASRWPGYEFRVQLGQSLLVSLEDEVRWCVTHRCAPPGPLPDFMGCIRFDALAGIRPQAVRITR